VKIDVGESEPMSSAPVDARMLRQALLNLVINAIQAMPRGGTVTLGAVQERRDGIAWVRIEVTDTGPGVPPELTERIFEPFFTTKAAGTGLGLAVVKRIVEAHKGELSLKSATGEGARFTLRLPLATT
jgi:signal transduction histidine kinase